MRGRAIHINSGRQKVPGYGSLLPVAEHEQCVIPRRGGRQTTDRIPRSLSHCCSSVSVRSPSLLDGFVLSVNDNWKRQLSRDTLAGNIGGHLNNVSSDPRYVCSSGLLG